MHSYSPASPSGRIPQGGIPNENLDPPIFQLWYPSSIVQTEMAQVDLDMTDLNVDARPWVPSFSPPTSTGMAPATEERVREYPLLPLPEKYMRVTRPVPHISERDDSYLPYYSQKALPRHHARTETISHKSAVPVPHHRVYASQAYSPEQRYLSSERHYTPPAREKRQQPVHDTLLDRPRNYHMHESRKTSYQHRSDPGSRSHYPQPTPPRMEYSRPPVSTPHYVPVVSSARYVPDPADFIRQHYARLV